VPIGRDDGRESSDEPEGVVAVLAVLWSERSGGHPESVHRQHPLGRRRREDVRGDLGQRPASSEVSSQGRQLLSVGQRVVPEQVQRLLERRSIRQLLDGKTGDYQASRCPVDAAKARSGRDHAFQSGYEGDRKLIAHPRDTLLPSAFC
jgi:hypothetical protein